MANETSTTEATESKPLLGNKETQKDVEAGNDGNKVIATKASETILEDVIETLTLAFPIFITSLSWVGVSTTVIAGSFDELIRSDSSIAMHRIKNLTRCFCSLCRCRSHASRIQKQQSMYVSETT